MKRRQFLAAMGSLAGCVIGPSVSFGQPATPLTPSESPGTPPAPAVVQRPATENQSVRVNEPKGQSGPVGLGFSCYGMKSLDIFDAVRQCAEIGYDCVELALMPEWPTAPERLSATDRARLRDELGRREVRVSALMENLPLVVPLEKHRTHLDRLRAAAALGNDLQPKSPPLLETVLGGKPAEWDSTRDAMAEHLADWAKVAHDNHLTLAIKAHVSGAAHLPEHIVWLLDQVNHPALRAVYDFSHFELRGKDLDSTWDVLRSRTAFIHVKDVRGTLDKFQFALPGEVRTDYAPFVGRIASSGYTGDIVVEVSAQVHNQPGYQPIEAARRCYATLDSAFQQSKTRRH